KVATQFDVPRADLDKITHENAMRWYSYDPFAHIAKEDATVGALRAFCDGRIARHKVPRYFRFVEDFPMTVTGKVQKFKLREAAIEEMGLQSAAVVKNA
ncbi:MAG: fatty-acyl-CoA synthase, partial [Frankiales bacterium]|nr:fatty-acyl-CoA synthase [Frankiales bacterium]